VGGWMDGWTIGWMARWMCGWVGGWMDILDRLDNYVSSTNISWGFRFTLASPLEPVTTTFTKIYSALFIVIRNVH
jgi:hypothetical protein